MPSRKLWSALAKKICQLRGSKHGCIVNMTETRPDASWDMNMILYIESEVSVSSTVKAIIATMKEQTRPMQRLRKRAALSD